MKKRNLISRARLKHSAASSKSLSLTAFDPLSINSSANSKDFSRSPSEEVSAEVSAALLLLLQVDSVPPWRLDSMVASLDVWVSRELGARVSLPLVDSIVTEASDVEFWVSFSSTIAFLFLWEMKFWRVSSFLFALQKWKTLFWAEKVGAIYSWGEF